MLANVTLRFDTLVDAAWREDSIDKAGFEGLFAHGPRKRYGGAPESGTTAYLLGLMAAGAAAAWLLARSRADRERGTGMI